MGARRRFDPSDFARPAVDLARRLLGCTLVHGETAGIIVETEAYAGDPASHYVTRRPSAGHLLGSTHGLVYVYSIYGLHRCLNFTADAEGPGAVLLRALEPTEGVELMEERRGTGRLRDLAAGPGRLAQALGISPEVNGRPVLDVFELRPPARAPRVLAGPRIGISVAQELPWRFAVEGSRFLSRPLRPTSR